MTPITASDGTDYLKIVNDRSWRVRWRKKAEIKNDAPTNGTVEVEPIGYSVVISVALLDEEGEVAVSPSGKLMIFEPHTLTWQQVAIGREDFDPMAELEAVIDERIAVAEAEIGGKTAIYDVLAMCAPADTSDDDSGEPV